MTTHDLVLRRHPFDQSPGVFPVRAGQSLGAMLREGAQGAELSELLTVSINGVEVPRQYWDRVRPKEGALIQVTGQVAGNGGGRNVLRSVLMIVVAVVAMWVTGGGAAGALGSAFGAGTFGAYALGAAVSVVGTLAVNALVPPPKPPSPTGTDGRWNMLTGTSNHMDPYGAVPCVVGEMRFYPKHAAIPYTVSVGEDSYQYCLFDLGFLTTGATVTDLRIGDTPIGDFQGVSYEVTTTPTIYRSDVAETAVMAGLEDNEEVIRTTAPDVDEVALEVVYAAGLFGVGTNGKDFARDGYWDFHYRAVGSPTWLALPSPRLSGVEANATADGTHKIRAMRKKPFAIGVAFDVAPGQYEVRVKRRAHPEGNSDNTFVDDSTYTVLRSIRHTNPSTTGTTKLAMRIKANDQLNGALQTLSCLVRQKIPVWDRITDTWSDQFSLNTAWVTYWLATECAALHTHAPASRMDLERWADYAEFCDLHGLETRRTLDGRQTCGELLNDVLAGSLASLGQVNGKYAPVFDAGESTPSMVFTELEAGEFRGQRAFVRVPHALRVRFVNPDANWRSDEIVVLDDGYSYRGVDARGVASALPEPTRFESVELQIACEPAQAWRLGRFHLAQIKYRASVYHWRADISALGVTRGDVVDVQSPVTEWGVGAGFVVSVAAGGPTGAATVVLTDEVETDPAKTYRAQVRRVSGGAIVATETYDVTPHAPISATFYFATMPTLAAGDVVVIGETAQGSRRLLVTGCAGDKDLGFTLSGVPYDARVAPYWANPPASFTSEITGGVIDPPDPPNVIGVISGPDNDDRNDEGITVPSVQIGIGGQTGFVRNIER